MTFTPVPSPVDELQKLERRFAKKRLGYREAKYQMLQDTMAEVLKLRSDDDALEAFILSADIERPMANGQSKSWITLAALTFVTHNKQLAWKGARVLEYLFDVKKVHLDRLARAIRKKGGIEKVLKLATDEDPRRKKESETEDEEEVKLCWGKPKEPEFEGNGKTATKTPDVSDSNGEGPEVLFSISSELQARLYGVERGRRVKLIGTLTEKYKGAGAVLQVEQVRLLKH